MPQTSFTSAPSKGYPGQIAEADDGDVVSAVVEQAGGIKPGLLVFRSTGGDNTARLPPAVAAAPTAIKTNIASSGSVQNLATGDFNGAVGAGLIAPSAKVTLVLSSHANWSATTATLSGLDQDGVPVSESLSIPAGGNTTLTSTNYYSRVTALTIPAQGGTSGTATLGTAASVSLDGGDILGVSVRSHKALISPSSSNNEVYEDDDVMPVMRSGRVLVSVENAFRAGDVAMVRCVAAGAEQLGAFRAHDSDSGDCFPVRRARFMNSGTSSDLAILEVNF